MREIGVRQLKATLSEVLRSIDDGSSVRVTVHGRPIADIVPPKPTSTEERLAELERQGRLTRATRPFDPGIPPQPSRSGRSGTAQILADREGTK